MEKNLLEQEMEVKNSLSPILVMRNKSILFLNRKCILEAYQSLIVFTIDVYTVNILHTFRRFKVYECSRPIKSLPQLKQLFF